MFLGMSIARQVLEKAKLPGRDQLVIFVTDGEDSFATDLNDQAVALKKAGVRIVTIAAGAVVKSARLKGPTTAIKIPKDPRSALATLRDAATSCSCTTPDGNPCTDDMCMATAKCTGDCYQSENYQELVDTVVVDIVRQNCEMLTKISPPLICSSRSETIVAEGVGFGAKQPAAGQIKFKVGGRIFDGVWKSDNRAVLPVGPWNNQYGASINWSPIQRKYSEHSSYTQKFTVTPTTRYC
jgi:hypothetical protein